MLKENVSMQKLCEHFAENKEELNSVGNFVAETVLF